MKSKGEKGTFCNTALEVNRIGNGFDLSKGFIGIVINKKQAIDLMNYLQIELKDEVEDE